MHAAIPALLLLLDVGVDTAPVATDEPTGVYVRLAHDIARPAKEFSVDLAVQPSVGSPRSGLHWSKPIQLVGEVMQHGLPDKNSMTPDPNHFRLDASADDWQRSFSLVGPSCASAHSTPDGVRLRACPGSMDSRGVMLFTKQAFSGDIKVEYEYMLHSAESVPSGTVSALMLMAAGDGSAGFPIDPNQWSDLPAGSGYRDHLYGLQLNYAYRTDPRGNDVIRLRGLKGSNSEDYADLGTSPRRFSFADGQIYRMTVIRKGDTLSIAVKNNTTSESSITSFSSSYIGALQSGHIGFRNMRGRDTTIANVVVSSK